ncbi:MAG: TIGR02221 family CRISPR-associated protein [Brockia lithotrophica]|nr:TIGR02221 family CRISPR-associated protein [Brockia lithotrophica]
MARKLISFLGTNSYQTAHYHFRGKQSRSTSYVQVALYEFLLTEYDPDDRLIVLVTDGAYETNWIGDDKLEAQLRRALAELGRGHTMDRNVRLRRIPAGDDEQSLWEIYKIVLDNIHHGDRVIFDITHTFRYLPFFVSSVVQYARFLKDVPIEGIYYGKFNGSDKENPIIDLMPFVTLLDWAMATEDFLRSGNADALEAIVRDARRRYFTAGKSRDIADRSGREEDEKALKAHQRLVDALKAFTDAMRTCRTPELIPLANRVKEALREAEAQTISFLPLLNPLLEKVKAKFEGRFVDPVHVQLDAARWSREHGMIQQAYTFLREGVITLAAHATGIDPDDEMAREQVVGPVLSSMVTEPDGGVSRSGASGNKAENASPARARVEARLRPYQDLIKEGYGQLMDYRNSINHAGIRRNSRPRAEKLIRELENLLAWAEELGEKLAPLGRPPASPEGRPAASGECGGRQLLIVMSHALLPEQKREAEERFGVTTFVSLPEDLQARWSNVDPELSRLDDWLRPIAGWMEGIGRPGDYVLIQGEHGATVWLVARARRAGLVPIYATTRREARERREPDGSVVTERIFRHVRFRLYPKGDEA